MDEEEKLANFSAITGADPERARQYLGVCDGDLDSAVNLYLESGGAALDGGPSRPVASVPETTAIDDDDDAALAERLQQEENQRQPEPVRERIAPRTETLVEDFGYSHYMPSSVPSSRSLPPSVFNQGPEGLPRSMNLTETQSRLGQLFRPPYDIMSNYDIDTAKIKGRDEKKWLLVNVQDISDFQCQVLNRDFWSNDAVKETVRANFIFLQYSKDNYDGQSFLSYYPVRRFPYIAVLDPRTGEEMKSWSEVPAPEDWVMSVHEFLERFSLDPKSRNPLGKLAKHKPIDHMSESEQLNFALKQSLGQEADESEEASELSSVSAAESMDEDDLIEDVHSSSRDKGKKKIEVIDLDEDEPKLESEQTAEDLFAAIQPVERSEPVADPTTTTRVQIRLGDGSRKIRRFTLTDPVRYLFEYVKADIPETRGRHFQIISTDRKKLIEFLEQTIEEAGLKNAVVLVEIEED
ncbi:thioredoxin-like protein [Lipomyces tetrasporus]